MAGYSGLVMYAAAAVLLWATVSKSLRLQARQLVILAYAFDSPDKDRLVDSGPRLALRRSAGLCRKMDDMYTQRILKIANSDTTSEEHPSPGTSCAQIIQIESDQDTVYIEIEKSEILVTTQG